MGDNLDYVATRQSSVQPANNHPSAPGLGTGQLGDSGGVLPVKNGGLERSNSLVETRSETGSIPTFLAITDL